MARRSPVGAEPLIISPEDGDLQQFVFRRSYNDDGSIRYVQIIGYAEELEAAAEQRPVRLEKLNKRKQTQMSLPRLIAQRMLGRPLTDSEVVTWRNGKRGDNRRANIEVVDRSELQGAHREVKSATGRKYIYPTSSGRFSVNLSNKYLGVYDTVELAEQALERYFQLLNAGLSEDEAANRVKLEAPRPIRRHSNLLIQS